MAKYFISGPPFTYRGAKGRIYHISPANRGDDRIFDTADLSLDLPASWVPPIVGLVAMDEDAQAAIAAVRAPYSPDEQLIGIGKLPPNDIFAP